MNFFSNKSQIGNIDNTLICIETHKSVFWVFNYLMKMYLVKYFRVGEEICIAKYSPQLSHFLFRNGPPESGLARVDANPQTQHGRRFKNHKPKTRCRPFFI